MQKFLGLRTCAGIRPGGCAHVWASMQAKVAHKQDIGCEVAAQICSSQNLKHVFVSVLAAGIFYGPAVC